MHPCHRVRAVILGAGGKMNRRVWKRTMVRGGAGILCAMLLSATGCGSKRARLPDLQNAPQIGVASYYAHKFHGRKTASGERYDENKQTAAHRTLPFGTLVRVTNLANDRSVEVWINDRGPWVKGRIIDVSFAAAKQLGLIGPGTAKVRVRVLSRSVP